MVIMSNPTPLYFGPEAAGSFKQGQVAAGGSDARALVVLAMLSAFEAVELRSSPAAQATMAAFTAGLLALVAWAAARPESYRRGRTGVVAAVRLLCAAKLLVSSSDSFAAPASGAEAAPSASLRMAALHFVLLLAWESGALLLSQMAWTLELPPLLAAAVQLMGVAAVAARNPRVCAAPYMQHPQNRRLLGRVYRVLQPAVAPLEPLLAAVGVSSEHSMSRQCTCVLAVLLFWGALVLSVVLATRGQLLAYLEWRRQRLGRQRAQRRQRGLTALAGPNRSSAAAAVGGGSGGSGSGSAKSSPASVATVSPSGLRSNSSSSGRSSLSSDSLDDPTGLFGSPISLSLAQLLKPARRGGRPHPDDWQWEYAARLMVDLRLSWLQLVLLAVGVAQMWAWHATLYPALEA